MSNESTTNSESQSTATEGSTDTGVEDKTADTLFDADKGNKSEDKSAASEDKTTADDKGGKDNDDGAKDDDKSDGENKEIEYDFEFPEGAEVDQEFLDDFTKMAKEKGLSQEDAQDIVDFVPKIADRLIEKQLEVIHERGEEWKATMRNDKELGGDKLDETLSVAKKALDTIGTPELKALLGPHDPEKNPTGTYFGNHPAILRFFHAVGTRIMDDNDFVNSGKQGSERSIADKIFDHKPN